MCVCVSKCLKAKVVPKARGKTYTIEGLDPGLRFQLSPSWLGAKTSLCQPTPVVARYVALARKIAYDLSPDRPHREFMGVFVDKLESA